MKWLAGASRFAAQVWDRGESPANWLNFGGNPSEVYSHWLNWAVMSGSAVILSWMLALDWIATRRCGTSPRTRWLVRTFPLLAIAVSWSWAALLDRRHGEHATAPAIVIFYMPVLAATFFLVRGLATRLRRFRTVLPVSASFALLHLACQWVYEPSGSGGPNWLVFPATAVLMLVFALERYLLDRPGEDHSNAAPRICP
jgi:hypothetical protein